MAQGRRPRLSRVDANSFRIRFTGGGISPRVVRLGELAEVLRAIEEALAAIMRLPPEEVVLGLIGVRDKSADYACALPSHEAARAVEAWGTAIDESNFSQLPTAAVDPTKRVLTFVRRRNCEAEIYTGRARKPLALMNADTVVTAPKREPLVGPTTLYGFCQRVGGAEPKLWMKLVDSAAITVDIANEDLARRIGQHLYEWIGVSGSAKWDAQTRELLEFRVDELVPYGGPQSAASGLEELANLLGPDILHVTEADIGGLRN